MDTSKHTPLPWFEHEGWVYAGTPTEKKRGLVAGFDKAVCQMDDLDCKPRELKHNAAFIVRAANSHDPLVAALKEIVENAKAADQGDIEAWAQELYECGKTARAALAAAGA